MPEPQLLTFRKYNDPALAEPLIELLQKNDIDYEFIESPMVFSASLTFSEELNREYAVKVRPGDFDKAEQLLIDDEAQHIDDVENDYYLFAFSDDELLDVVTNYEEWGTFDVVLARKILNERGIKIDDLKLKEQKITALKKPEEANGGWIIAGYLMALAGGLLGILIGWFLWTSKKTLPNGERLYAYDEVDRWHGKRIFFIGVIVFAIAIWFRFYSLMNL